MAYLLFLLLAFLGNNFRAMVDRNFQWWKNQPRKKAKLKVRIFDKALREFMRGASQSMTPQQIAA